MPEQLLQVAVWVVCRLTFEMNLGLFMQRWHEIRRIAVPGQPILPSALLISSKHLLSIGFAGGAHRMDNTFTAGASCDCGDSDRGRRLIYNQRNSSKRLKQRFGPKYDRTVERLKNRDDAEKEQRAREARVTR
jgi:hypothetical protein